MFGKVIGRSINNDNDNNDNKDIQCETIDETAYNGNDNNNRTDVYLCHCCHNNDNIDKLSGIFTLVFFSDWI